MLSPECEPLSVEVSWNTDPLPSAEDTQVGCTEESESRGAYKSMVCLSVCSICRINKEIIFLILDSAGFLIGL